MITAVVILALKSALGLLSIWLLVFLLWKDYCLDTFREDVFAIQDALFLYAADGSVGFDHPAYRMLRQKMNVSLRYAHEFTLIRFVLAIIVLSKVPNAETVAWEEALGTLPSDVQKSLTHYRNDFLYGFLKYVTLRSFFLYAFLYAVVLVVRVFGVCKQAIKRYILPQIVVGIERLESEALDEELRNGEGALRVGAA